MMHSEAALCHPSEQDVYIHKGSRCAPPSYHEHATKCVSDDTRASIKPGLLSVALKLQKSASSDGDEVTSPRIPACHDVQEPMPSVHSCRLLSTREATGSTEVTRTTDSDETMDGKRESFKAMVTAAWRRLRAFCLCSLMLETYEGVEELYINPTSTTITETSSELDTRVLDNALAWVGSSTCSVQSYRTSQDSVGVLPGTMSLDDSSDHILEVIDRVPWHDMRAGGINDFELLPDGDCCHTADSAAYACGCVGSGGHDNILKRRMKRHIERHGRLACAEAEVEAAAAIVSGKGKSSSLTGPFTSCMSTGSSTLSGNRSVALTTVIGFDVPFNTRDVKWKAELTGDLKSPFHYVIEEPTEPGVVEHVPGCNQSGCFGECMGLRRDLQDDEPGNTKTRLIAKPYKAGDKHDYTFMKSSEDPVDLVKVFAPPVLLQRRR